MFGYIQINQKELKIREYETYRSYYCGLCHVLKERYGRMAQMMLNYDMTFLAILLTGLYEPEKETGRNRCLPHPAVRHNYTKTDATGYAADMTVLLAYQKALDDWRDDRSRPGRVMAMALYRDYARLRSQYPRQAKTLERCVRELSAAEKACCEDLDYVSGLTGEFLSEIFDWKEDIWRQDLKQMGFYMGKFIYLMDAWDDLEKDRKKGRYNLLAHLEKEDPGNFEQRVKAIMTDMMSRSCRAFERLPVISEAGILRNILYGGVWVRYGKGQNQFRARSRKTAEHNGSAQN